MTCNTCQTEYSNSHLVMGMDINMENNLNHKSIRLQAVGCRTLAQCAGNLLTAIGSLLQSHPDLHAEISPQSAQMLISLGKKIHKASLQAG